ncbi:hypothetical protein LCL87_14930 [Rhodococcus hoagii]|nr:hypothetical protein [Prescottella equi]
MNGAADALKRGIARSVHGHPAEAVTDQDLGIVLARLRSTDVRKAVITGQNVQTDPYADEDDWDKFLRVFSPKQKPEDDETPKDNPLPLNGAGLLRAALGGNTGTINGHATDSAAGLIRSVIAGRQDFAG